MAISNDFLESDLPKPELSGDDDDFPDKLCGEFLSSCLGGISLRILITRSTILFPYDPGLTLSLAFAYARFKAGIGTELPLLRLNPLSPPLTPLGSRPLEGEHDCLLTPRPFGTGSIDEDRLLGAPARPRTDEIGLSVNEVRKFGGASRVYPGISCGFHGLGLVVGEFKTGCVVFVFLSVGDVTDGAGVFVTGLRVGVGVRRAGLVAVKDGLLVVGVEDLGVDLVGVEDRSGAVGLDEGKTGREVVGVEDLEGLEAGFEIVAVFGTGFDMVLDGVPETVLPVGVKGLEPEPEPPDEVGLRGPVLGPGEAGRCLDTKLFLVASGWLFDNLDFGAFG